MENSMREVGAIIQEKVCNLKSVKSGVSVCMSVCVCLQENKRERRWGLHTLHIRYKK